MQPDFDYLLFDLDGTLVDSVPDLASSVNLLRHELGLFPLSLAQTAAMVGDGASVLVQRAVGEQFRPELTGRFLAIYAEHLLDQTLCYPGIEELLSRYPASRLGVVTNKPYQLSVDLLTGLGLIGKFGVVIGGDSLPCKKPDPEPVFEALKILGADPQRSIMIGDHHTDLKAGQGAGIATCFCSYGMGNNGGLSSDYQVAAATELLTLFPG